MTIVEAAGAQGPREHDHIQAELVLFGALPTKRLVPVCFIPKPSTFRAVNTGKP